MVREHTPYDFSALQFVETCLRASMWSVLLSDTYVLGGKMYILQFNFSFCPPCHCFWFSKFYKVKSGTKVGLPSFSFIGLYIKRDPYLDIPKRCLHSFPDIQTTACYPEILFFELDAMTEWHFWFVSLGQVNFTCRKESESSILWPEGQTLVFYECCSQNILDCQPSRHIILIG